VIRLRRGLHVLARHASTHMPGPVREVALALAARAIGGPALLPGPPPGPVLVVAPHPDDETIGCGGALARHVRQGDPVTVLVATSGERATGGTGDVAATREAECRAACAELGVGQPLFLRLPDGGLSGEIGRLAEVVRVRGAGAATVYVPSVLDLHSDHRAANAAVAAAGLEADVYGYEVWAVGPIDRLLDVEAVYPAKERALGRYVTALATIDYRRAARGLAAYRSIAGGLAGAGLAEGFVYFSAREHAEFTRRAGIA